MHTRPTRLRALLRARHLQNFPAFCREYDRIASVLDPALVGRHPSRAQFFRWQSGELLGLPYPDHCRVLEAMFSGVGIREIFATDDGEPAVRPAPQARPAVLDVVAAFATRAEFAATMPVHGLFDGARDIRAVGLSLNLISQQYPDAQLREMVENGTRLRCAFLRPDGTAIGIREREEGHPPGLLSDLTRTNIAALVRLRSRLTEAARERVELRAYDEVPRQNVLLVDDETCVAQPYLPRCARCRLAHLRAPQDAGCARPVSGVRAGVRDAVGAGVPAVTELARLRRIADGALDLARSLVTHERVAETRDKGDRDPVTALDTVVEDAVRRYLRAATPDLGFLGEETGGSLNGPSWVLDPVDGTVNLTHGLPLSAVSLGLVDAGRAVLAAVDLPFLDLRYSAALGAGAHRDGERLRPAPATRLRDAVVSLGDYAVGQHADRKNAVRLRVTSRLAGRAQRIRMLGSAVIDLAWVADGRLGASVVLANRPWEGAAGALLAREAGAVVVDVEGRDHTMDSTSTVAVAPGLAEELLELLRD